MAVLSFFNFRKMRNAISPKLLPEQYAQLAIETDTRKGTLQSFDGTQKVTDLAKSGTLRTIFPLVSDLWLHWNENVKLARAPIANNEYHRVVFTGTDVPRYTDVNLARAGGGTRYPEVSYALGLPQPEGKLRATVEQRPLEGAFQLLWDIAGTTDLQSGGRAARSYSYTFVSANGDEGPPSEPSDIVFANDDDCAVLTDFAAMPTGAYNIEKVRIYRTVSGSGGFTWLLVDEVDMPVTTYKDCKLESELGASMTSALYSPPPENLQGVVAMANGMLAGFVGNAVYFSEPYQGHAWPEDYTRYVDHDIIGLSSSGNMVYILTKGWPYVAIGNHPTTIALTKLDKAQACVSAASIADMGGGVIYAAEDGLVAILGGTTVTMLTDQTVDHKFWRSLNPSSMLGVYHNNRYYGFYEAPAQPDPQLPAAGGFVYDTRGDKQELMMLNLHTTAAYGDPITGDLFFVQKNGAANELWRWDADPANKRPFVWRSRITESNLRNLEAARISARAWPVRFRLYVEGNEVFQRDVTNSEPFRLPTGYQARNVEIQVEASVEIDSVMLADYVGELQ
jgi:hypothetical protein